jgi:hypothetical protein
MIKKNDVDFLKKQIDEIQKKYEFDRLTVQEATDIVFGENDILDKFVRDNELLGEGWDDEGYVSVREYQHQAVAHMASFRKGE